MNSTLRRPRPSRSNRTYPLQSRSLPRSASGSALRNSRNLCGGRLAMRRNQVGIPAGRRLRDAAMGWIIDIYQSKALAVTRSPLEIVQQRPDEIAAHVGAGCDRALHGLDIRLDIGDASR